MQLVCVMMLFVLRGSCQKTELIKRRQYKLKAAVGDNKVYFSGKS